MIRIGTSREYNEYHHICIYIEGHHYSSNCNNNRTNDNHVRTHQNPRSINLRLNQPCTAHWSVVCIVVYRYYRTTQDPHAEWARKRDILFAHSLILHNNANIMRNPRSSFSALKVSVCVCRCDYVANLSAENLCGLAFRCFRKLCPFSIRVWVILQRQTNYLGHDCVV